MDLSKLDDDQIQVALKVIASAKKYGINPDFVLPMVNVESGFRPQATSGMAVGPMQLTQATAKDLGVDPTNVDQNIDGGMRFLKSLIENKKLKGDPHYIFAAYNAGPNAKFFETGDFKDLPDETVNHVVRVMRSYGDKVPEITIEKSEEPKRETAPASVEEQYSGEPVATEPSMEEQGRSPKELGAVGAALGAGAGSVYTAKAPLFRMAQRVGLLPGGKPISPSEAADLVERTMSGAPEAARPTHGGEKWQKALTGVSTPGAQMDKASLDLAKGMQQAVGIGGAPGFTGGTISPGGVILSPQDAAAVKARQEMAAAQIAQREARLQQTMQRAAQPDTVRNLAQTVMRSAPVRGALAGLGTGYNLQDAYQKFDQGDMLGGAAAAGGAGASALTLVPKLARAMGPAAIGLTTGSQMIGDIRRGDRQSAAEDLLTGLTALAPRVFGPLAAGVYSRGLNEGEAEELARRRMLPPTISP